MQLSIDIEQVLGAVLASIRIVAFLLIAPPFSGSMIPVKVKVGVAVALSAVVAPGFEAPPELLEPARLMAAAVYQVAVGLALGFCVFLLFSAVQSAGQLVDFSAAFSSAQIFDPTANAALSPMSRFYQLLATTLLFSSGGHLLLLGGLLRSFQAAPLTGLQLDRLGNVLTDNLARFFVAAVQIALPLVAALFVAELLLGFLAKAAPQMNLLVIGFSIKGVVIMALGGLSIGMLPLAVERLVDLMMRSMGAIAGVGG